MKRPPLRPLSALLSQTLVALTIEIDNEFERRMRKAGYDGAGLSLVLWLWLVRFLAENEFAVGELAAKAFDTPERIKFALGCLERWRFAKLEPPAGEGVKMKLHRQRGKQLRDGWGSGRGIGGDWIVQLTEKGTKAAEIWRPLPEEIEERWRERFGSQTINRLRESLLAVVSKVAFELPHGLAGDWQVVKVGAERGTNELPLAALLSQALFLFRIEFNRSAAAGIGLSANLLRVLSKEGVRGKEIASLTGASPEESGVGWQAKKYVTVTSEPKNKRGKVVALTPLGVKAQETYFQLVEQIEKKWQARVGKEQIGALHETLEELLTRRDGERPLIVVGLIPPAGVVRAGHQAPALGRKEVAAAARQRVRELVAQTKMFIADPATLPHFPLWDMNRGFGP